MKELVKVENETFKNFYEGVAGNKKVVCILDNCCVRWMALRLTKTGSWKCVSRHEFSNSEKELCFKNATKALNK